MSVNMRFEACRDEELAVLARQGSAAAIEALVCRYEARLYRYAVSVCRDHSDAQEITQDTFVRAWLSLHQFDPKRSFAAWLFMIARRKCIDHLRRPRLQTSTSLPELHDPHDPVSLLSVKEEQGNLWNLARERLSQAQFDTLWMRYAEDMDIAEIAQVLGKTRTHIKVLLFRARIVLVKHLERKRQKEPSSPVLAHFHPNPACSEPVPVNKFGLAVISGNEA